MEKTEQTKTEEMIDRLIDESKSMDVKAENYINSAKELQAEARGLRNAVYAIHGAIKKDKVTVE